MFQSLKDTFDRRERLQLYVSLDLTVSREGQCFGHILACTDERTADGDAVCHHIEQGYRKLAGGRPTRTQVPRLRVIATPWLKAMSDGAVMSTP